jgi:hypothetical protein
MLMSRFKPGQVWIYHTRPGEEDSRLMVIKVEPHDKLGTIVHIRVEGVAQTNPHAPLGVSRVINHMPFAAEAIGKSVIELTASDVPVPTSFEEGYGFWKEAFDKGKAGVFTITVAESITLCEGILNKAQAEPGAAADRPRE